MSSDIKQILPWKDDYSTLVSPRLAEYYDRYKMINDPVADDLFYKLSIKCPNKVIDETLTKMYQHLETEHIAKDIVIYNTKNIPFSYGSGVLSFYQFYTKNGYTTECSVCLKNFINEYFPKNKGMLLNSMFVAMHPSSYNFTWKRSKEKFYKLVIPLDNNLEIQTMTNNHILKPGEVGVFNFSTWHWFHPENESCDYLFITLLKDDFKKYISEK